NSDGGLAGFAIADDQFTLSSADRRHRIDGLDAGLQGLIDGLTLGNTWSIGFDEAIFGADNRPFAIEGVTEWIDNTANHRIADGHAQKLAGATHFITFGDFQIIAKDDDADRVFFQIESQTAHSGAGKFHQLTGHDTGQPVDARDAIAYLQHATH